MRIETFIRGRSIGSEDPGSAYQTYLAMLAVIDEVDFFVIDEDLDYAVSMTDWGKAYNYAFNQFDSWFADMIDNHEIHVQLLNGERYLDQFLVTVG